MVIGKRLNCDTRAKVILKMKSDFCSLLPSHKNKIRGWVIGNSDIAGGLKF